LKKGHTERSVSFWTTWRIFSRPFILQEQRDWRIYG